MENKSLFSERQHFRQIWLWVILLGTDSLFIYGLIKQVFLGEKFGTKPMSDTGIIISTMLVLSLSVLFLNMRLDTKIKTDGIYVRFFPFQLSFRFYPWNNLHQSYVRQYNPILEYGGWGLRGIRYNRAFNVSGDQGIQLVMQNEMKFLIGTNKPNEAKETLMRLGHLTTI